MDKYEYRIRAEEINSLIEQQEYAEAVKIADTIDWRRVRSVVMLCKVSELYKMNRRYEDSKEVLLLAYDLQPGSRKIIYSLCELSIKLEETVQAVEYYKEFVQVAPRDTGRFILQYRLYEAQDVSLEERIAVLEEYKKRDYREKWAYELAYLYHRIGLATRCVEECDELILWFGEGKYVIKAMELKMLHAPLTPQQQEKYNARFLSEMEAIAAVEEEENQAQEEVQPSMSIEIKAVEATNAKTAKIPAKKIQQETELQAGDTREIVTPETEEERLQAQQLAEMEALVEEIGDPDALPEDDSGEEPVISENEQEDVTASAGQEESAPDEAEDEDADMKIVHSMDDLDIHVKTIDVDDQYSTINLQEAIAKDLAQLFAQEDMGASDATRALPVESLEAASQLLQKEADKNPEESEKSEETIESEEQKENEKIVESEEQKETEETIKTEEQEEVQVNGSGAEAVMQAMAEVSDDPLHLTAEESDGLLQSTEEEPDISQMSENDSVREIKMESQDLDDLTQLLPPMDLSIVEKETEIPVEDNPEVTDTESEAENMIEAEEEQEITPKSEDKMETVSDEGTEGEEASETASDDGTEDEQAIEQAPQKELEPLIFSNNAPLPEALIQAMQTVAIEAAKEAAVAAAKEAAKETAVAMQPEIKKEENAAIREVITPETEKPQEEEPSEQVEKQITGQLSFTDIMDEWEKTKKANEEKHLEEMKQRVLEQTGPLFSNFDSMTLSNNQDELNMLSPMLDVFSETEELAGQVQQALDEELEEASKMPEISEPDFSEAEKQQGVDQEKTEWKETSFWDKAKEQKPADTYTEPENIESEEAVLQSESPSLEELPQTETMAEADNEIADHVSSFNTAEINGLEEKLMTALSVQHYETSNLQVEALSEELSASQVSVQTEKENSVVSLETSGSQEPRYFTKTEKEIFGSIAPTKELQQTFTAFLDHISLYPTSGNVILTGEKGINTLEVAQNIAGYLIRERSGFTGNIETYTFEDLKEKDIIATIENLKNGIMIINQAGDLSQQACITLINAMKNMTGGGIVVILADTQRDIERLKRSFSRLDEYFTTTFDITTLDNDGLVNFGKEYARQQEYSIDAMGVLALYNRIEELQTIDHAVNVEEVKQIVNEAIQNADKKNVAHFMDVIFAKRYDKEDMIVLREKDFLTEKK